MFIIQFGDRSSPLDKTLGNRAEFVGPFGSDEAAHVWIQENDRDADLPVVYPLTDPASEMFRSLLTK